MCWFNCASSYSSQTDAFSLWRLSFPGQLRYTFNKREKNMRLLRKLQFCCCWCHTCCSVNAGVYLTKMCVNLTKMKIFDSNIHYIGMWAKKMGIWFVVQIKRKSIFWGLERRGRVAGLLYMFIFRSQKMRTLCTVLILGIFWSPQQNKWSGCTQHF